MHIQSEVFSMHSIGVISSPFREKFGIPRQPGLATGIPAVLHLNPEFNAESVRQLETFSHLWIQFVFHATGQQGWRQTVRPPRLGGNRRVGVFASRSMFRPNPIGLSVVKLEGIKQTAQGVVIELSGGDFLDGTPVLDIKPYLPYADAIEEATGGFAPRAPGTRLPVAFTPDAKAMCQQATLRLGQDIEKRVIEVLSLDPRPAYHGQQQTASTSAAEKKMARRYSMKLYDFDLSWYHCENDEIVVTGLE